MIRSAALPPVKSIDEEDRAMGYCTCSGEWRLAANVVWPMTGRWIDHLDVACSDCGTRRAFDFDVTAFFMARPGIWSHARGAAA